MPEKTDIIRQDSNRYYMLTKPQRVTRAMHSLEGLLKGIAMDSEITLDEVGVLKKWLLENQSVLQHDPFNELKALIDSSLADGRIDEDEKQDLLWFCQKFTSEDNYFSAITSDLQRLHGILGGIICDNIIDKEELDGLQVWLDGHQALKNCWPFDEIERLVSAVLEDGRIDEQEHQILLDFFGEFFSFTEEIGRGSHDGRKPGVIRSVCAKAPQVVFGGRLFCFTGSSAREPRDTIREIIRRQGGQYAETFDESVNYLIIGAGGSPCWTYACYGRKVEQAVEWQRKGCAIQIIHEEDFWESLDHQLPPQPPRTRTD